MIKAAHVLETAKFNPSHEPAAIADTDSTKHHGPGPHPSGSPQSDHGRRHAQERQTQAPETRVGITSYGDPAAQPHATHTPEATAAAMAHLDAELTHLGVLHHLQLGRGGWEGGGEPTFVLAYQGNGRVFRLLVTFAKDHDQMAVLFAFPDGEERAHFLDFDFQLNESQIAAVEQLLSKSGIDYWTWFENEQGYTSLNVTEVKALGSPHTTRTKLRSVRKALQSRQLPYRWNYHPVTTLWIENYQYDEYIESGPPER